MLFHTLNTMQGSHQMSFFKRYFIGPWLFFFLVVFAAKIYDSRRENKERENVHGSPEKARCKFQERSPRGVTERRLSPPARRGVRVSWFTRDLSAHKLFLGTAPVDFLCLASTKIPRLPEVQQVFRENYCVHSLRK